MELHAEVEIELEKDGCRFHESMCVVSLVSVLMRKMERDIPLEEYGKSK